MCPARAAKEEPVAEFSWDQMAAWIVRRQHLDERVPLESALDVAAEICGLHAQLMSSAELTLWARVEGIERVAVRNALWEDRSLIKTWAMRGTLHLLPSREFPVWQAALSTYDHFRKSYWLRYNKVTEKDMDRLIDSVAAALDNRLLTREELAKTVAKDTRSKKLGELVRGSWGSMLKPASFAGGLCFAPSVGQNVRFTNPHSWLAKYKEKDPKKSLLEVTRRYLGAFGPAARDDLARWWTGVSPAQALKLIKELGSEVVPVDVGEERMWMLASDVDEMASSPKLKRSLRLLPAFDQFVVSVSRRADRIMPGPFKAKIYRKSAWLSPVVLVNGRMDGIWKHEKKGSRLIVVIESFVEFPAWARKSVEKEASSLADFMELELDLTWKDS